MNKLCTEYPNAYVLLGESYIPTRTELYPFEMFNIARERNMFKYYKALPIVLTLEEDQKIIYERFSSHLIFGSKIRFNNLDITTQVEFLVFLNSICNNREIQNIFENSKDYLESVFQLFDVTTWIKLMDYGMDPSFISEGERIEICVAVYRRKYKFEKGDHNCIGYEFSKLNDSMLQSTEKLQILSKALRFYKITLVQLQRSYKYIVYSGSGCSN